MFVDRARWRCVRRAEGAAPVVYAAAAILAWFVMAGSAQTAPPHGQTLPASASSGKPHSGKLPPAREILDKHLAAIGGRAAVLGHSSIAERGTFTMPKAGVTGDFTIFRAKPNKSVVRLTLGGVGEVVEGFDGTHGWSNSPITGPMLVEGKQLDDKRLDSEFYAELHDDQRYVAITTVEETTFDGRNCFKVRFVRKTGGEDFAFYDVATGLRAGGITTRDTHMGTITATSTEGDYKRFGDLLHPTTVRNTMAQIEQVFTVTSVEYDNVPASVFEMPTEIKALIK